MAPQYGAPRPGEEVTISYGDKSNEELLMLYGQLLLYSVLCFAPCCCGMPLSGYLRLRTLIFDKSFQACYSSYNVHEVPGGYGKTGQLAIISQYIHFADSSAFSSSLRERRKYALDYSYLQHFQASRWTPIVLTCSWCGAPSPTRRIGTRTSYPASSSCAPRASPLSSSSPPLTLRRSSGAFYFKYRFPFCLFELPRTDVYNYVNVLQLISVYSRI